MQFIKSREVAQSGLKYTRHMGLSLTNKMKWGKGSVLKMKIIKSQYTQIVLKGCCFSESQQCNSVSYFDTEFKSIIKGRVNFVWF